MITTAKEPSPLPSVKGYFFVVNLYFDFVHIWMEELPMLPSLYPYGRSIQMPSEIKGPKVMIVFRRKV